MSYLSYRKREAIGLLESHIERRMGEMVTRRGGLYYKFVSPGQPGVPDRIIVVPGGQCVFVELKTEVGRLSNIQKWQIERMKKMGLDVRKVSGWEQARALVEELFPDGIPAKEPYKREKPLKVPKDSRHWPAENGKGEFIYDDDDVSISEGWGAMDS